MNRYFEINKNGHNIRCKLYCQNPGAFRRVIISCQGFAGHKDNNATAHFADRVLSKYKEIAVVTFNWPCHGDDVKKKLSLDDCLTYLDLVIDHAKTHFGAEKLYACSVSFGGYVTLKYLLEHGDPFEKIALRSPAVPMFKTLTASIMTPDDREKLARGRDVLVGFDRKIPVNPTFLEEIRVNDLTKCDFLDYAEDLLILHGTNDEIVPFADVQAFADEQLIEFIPVEGADHRYRDASKMEFATKAILSFFSL